MKSAIVSALVVTLMAAGCSSTRMSYSAAKARSFDMNTYMLRGPITVQVKSRPEPMKAEFLTIQGDSVFWIDRATGDAMAAHISGVSGTSVQDRPTGLLIGLIGGTAAGVGLGAAVNDRTETTTLYMLGGYGLGGLLGYLIGYEREFIFEPDGTRR